MYEIFLIIILASLAPARAQTAQLANGDGKYVNFPQDTLFYMAYSIWSDAPISIYTAQGSYCTGSIPSTYLVTCTVTTPTSGFQRCTQRSNLTPMCTILVCRNAEGCSVSYNIKGFANNPGSDALPYVSSASAVRIHPPPLPPPFFIYVHPPPPHRTPPFPPYTSLHTRQSTSASATPTPSPTATLSFGATPSTSASPSVSASPKPPASPAAASNGGLVAGIVVGVVLALIGGGVFLCLRRRAEAARGTPYAGGPKVEVVPTVVYAQSPVPGAVYLNPVGGQQPQQPTFGGQPHQPTFGGAAW